MAARSGEHSADREPGDDDHRDDDQRRQEECPKREGEVRERRSPTVYPLTVAGLPSRRRRSARPFRLGKPLVRILPRWGRIDALHRCQRTPPGERALVVSAAWLAAA